MNRTYLVHYLTHKGKEEQIAVRCENRRDFKNFTKDMTVVGWCDVTKYDRHTQELKANGLEVERYVEECIATGNK